MSVGYLTSSTLIATIIREAMIPNTQSTFQESDFLAMANQEMRLGLVPSIMQHHQEYYVRDSAPVVLVANQDAYAIPYRAIGSKFREVFYQDTDGNLRSMTRISPDDRPYYQQTNFQNRFIYFYLQGNEVVLMPQVGSNPVGALIFSFWMRPNELVDESRVATILSETIVTNLSGSINNISATNPGVCTTPSPHGLSTGNVITISNSNSAPLIDGFQRVTVLSATTFSIPVSIELAGTGANWTYQTTTLQMDQIPSGVAAFSQGGVQNITGFTTSCLFDVMQRNPGHKTINYDVKALAIDPAGLTMIFNTGDIGNAIPGDYISFAGECIVPQAPADLQDVLSQRVVVRCLQALGDQAGYQMAMGKLTEMEKACGILVTNRSEGQPQKINNLRGVLRGAKIRKRGWL